MSIPTPTHSSGYRDILKPGRVAAIRELSGEMRHRMSNADADIRANMNRHLSGQMAGGFTGKAKQLHSGAIAHAYILIQYVQTYMVDLPLWLAAHAGAVKAGLEGDAAISAADDAVIVSQGAGGAKDTALIEGNVPFLEWMTMFYSYGNAFLNRQASIGRDVGKAAEGGLPGIAAEMPLLTARALFLVALPVLLDDLINQATGAADGPGDDDEWAAYYGARTAAYLFYGIPGIRDLAGAKYGYRLSPTQSIGESYMRLANDMEKAMGGDTPEARKVVRDAVSVAGYTLGLPLAGPFRHIDYLWRVIEGEEQPESIPEFAGAVVVGKREQR